MFISQYYYNEEDFTAVDMNSTESNITQGNTTSLYMFDNEYSGELRRINNTEEPDFDGVTYIPELPPVQYEDHDHNDHHKDHSPEHQKDHHHGMHHKNHNKQDFKDFLPFDKEEKSSDVISFSAPQCPTDSNMSVEELLEWMSNSDEVFVKNCA